MSLFYLSTYQTFLIIVLYYMHLSSEVLDLIPHLLRPLACWSSRPCPCSCPCPGDIGVPEEAVDACCQNADNGEENVQVWEMVKRRRVSTMRTETGGCKRGVAQCYSPTEPTTELGLIIKPEH